MYIHIRTHARICIYKVLKNDRSKIRGMVGDAKISGKCQKNQGPKSYRFRAGGNERIANHG